MMSYLDNKIQNLERLISSIGRVDPTVAQAIFELGQKLNDEEKKLGRIIDETKLSLQNINGEIVNLRQSINQANEDYQQTIRPLLDSLMDKRRHFRDVKKLLGTISKHPQEIQIINDLEGFKQQLSNIECVQKSQGIIRIGRCGYDKISKDKFPELVDSSESKIREANTYIDFGDTFSSLSDKAKIDVFVALAKVDAGCGFKDTIRVHVFAKSISKKGFTLVARTWLDSKLFYGDVVWIAVGK